MHVLLAHSSLVSLLPSGVPTGAGCQAGGSVSVALRMLGMPMGQVGEVFSPAHGWAFCWGPICGWQELCFFNALGYLYLPLSQSPPYPLPHIPSHLGERYGREMGFFNSTLHSQEAGGSLTALPFPPQERSLVSCSSGKALLLTLMGPGIFFSFLQ